MEKQICPECGEEARLTEDHLLPPWIARYTYYLGFSYVHVKKVAGFSIKDSRQMICGKCNSQKGAVLSYNNPIVRRFLWALIGLIEEKLSTGYVPRKVYVTCKCIECETVQKWNERAAKTAEIIKEIVTIHDQ